MKIDDNIEKISIEIKEKFGTGIYIFKVDGDWILVPEENNIENFGYIKKYFFERLKHIIDSDEIMIDNKIDIYEKSWEECIKELEPLFDTVKYQMKARLNIYVPNYAKEFMHLITILKDKYGSRKINFFVIEIGFNKFYNILRTSGLSDIIKVTNLINERFDNENFGEYDIKILDFIKKDISNRALFSLGITAGSISAIHRIAQDARLTISELGFISCIFTFNTAQEEFRDLISDKFKVYYRNDGFVQIIKDEIDRIVEDGIRWTINILPIMVENIEKLKDESVEQTDKGKEEIKEEVLYKKQAIEEIAVIILDNLSRRPIQVCTKSDLLVNLIVDEMNHNVFLSNDTDG